MAVCAAVAALAPLLLVAGVLWLRQRSCGGGSSRRASGAEPPGAPARAGRRGDRAARRVRRQPLQAGRPRAHGRRSHAAVRGAGAARAALVRDDHRGPRRRADPRRGRARARTSSSRSAGTGRCGRSPRGSSAPGSRWASCRSGTGNLLARNLDLPLSDPLGGPADRPGGPRPDDRRRLAAGAPVGVGGRRPGHRRRRARPDEPSCRATTSSSSSPASGSTPRWWPTPTSSSRRRVGWIAYFVPACATCTADAPACTSGSTTSR